MGHKIYRAGEVSGVMEGPGLDEKSQSGGSVAAILTSRLRWELTYVGNLKHSPSTDIKNTGCVS